IFSIKVAEVKEGLHWPLHVYGLIATRDSIDPRRNILFHRIRDNCQTITEGLCDHAPYLLLTGPSRAVGLIDPVTFEVQLKARGRTESEDEVLCFDILTTQHASGYLGCPPHISTSCLRCKQSKLEFAFAVLSQSVEATIRVEIVDGSWPEHLRGLLTTSTATIDHARILLVDSQDGRMPINGSGAIQLSRQVVLAFQVDDDNFYLVAAKGSVVFNPKEAAISNDTIDLGFCKLGVTVAWSLLAPVEHEPWGRPVRCTRTTPPSNGP
uniref:DUF6598 domain-containing protein n=1 Tax=Setaria italica TaxID=4555 RepID=K3XPQ7_SETIT